MKFGFGLGLVYYWREFDGFDSGWGLTETEVGLVSVWFRFGFGLVTFLVCKCGGRLPN